MRSLSVAATGMTAQQLNVEVISNNIADMTTTGFKHRRPEVQDLLYQSQRRIRAQGNVTAKLQGQTALAALGQLQLASFVNEGGLEALGNNLLRETDASGPAQVVPPGTQGLGPVQQGFL